MSLLTIVFITLLTILTFLTFLTFLTLQPPCEPYTTISPQFLTPNETLHLIASNSAFWGLLSDREWKKRGVSNLSEYLSRIRPTLVELTDTQKRNIGDMCKKADEMIERVHLPYFSGKKAVNIPWKIGVFSGNTYEYGWPHTMGDTILMPLTIDIHTLIHEKVHLYQRKYPHDFNTYLTTFNFRRWKRRADYDPLIRPNPDTDDWIYTENGTVMTEDRASHFPNRDPNPQFYESPLERMAIQIARKAQKGT